MNRRHDGADCHLGATDVMWGTPTAAAPVFTGGRRLGLDQPRRQSTTGTPKGCVGAGMYLHCWLRWWRMHWPFCDALADEPGLRCTAQGLGRLYGSVEADSRARGTGAADGSRQRSICRRPLSQASAVRYWGIRRRDRPAATTTAPCAGEMVRMVEAMPRRNVFRAATRRGASFVDLRWNRTGSRIGLRQSRRSHGRALSKPRRQGARGRRRVRLRYNQCWRLVEARAAYRTPLEAG